MLKGSLSTDATLFDLLQILGTRLTGELVVVSPGVTGSVAVARRRVLAARAQGLGGDDALALLAGLKTGQFSFNLGEPAGERNIDRPIEQVLTELVKVHETWQRLEYIPSDWTMRLYRRGLPPQLIREEKNLALFAEGKTVAEVLAQPGGVLKRAESLNRLLELGVLYPSLALGIGPKPLVALPYYGPRSEVAYLNPEVHAEWAEVLGPRFKLRVRAPSGKEAVLKAEPRERVPKDRVLIHDQELRKLRAGRGTRLRVAPEVSDGII